MGTYQKILDIAREQAASLGRGELDAAVALLEHRAELLVSAAPPGPEEVPFVQEILQLDRGLASAIRERMIRIRNDALEGKQGQKALGGYGRSAPRRPMAVDRLS